MGKTKREPRRKGGFDPLDPDSSLHDKVNRDGTVRDGTPTRNSHSCENNGGCPWCEDNRKHSTEKRKPLEDKE